MLIPAAVEAAKRDGRLVAAKPIAEWSAEPRVVLMCGAMQEALAKGRSDPDVRERQSWAKVEAAFSEFIEGSLITEHLVKQLKPYKFEHWEFRCRKPKPSLRIFGRFVMPDVFVATHVMPRKLLGGMYSAEFEHEKLVCEDHWASAGLSEPFTDSPAFRYESYITSNARRRLRIPA